MAVGIVAAAAPEEVQDLEARGVGEGVVAQAVEAVVQAGLVVTQAEESAVEAVRAVEAQGKVALAAV